MLSKAIHTQKNNLCGEINLSEKEYVVLLTPCGTHKFVDAAFFNKKKNLTLESIYGSFIGLILDKRVLERDSLFSSFSRQKLNISKININFSL